VGLYQGLKKLPLRGVPIDFLHLEYVGGSLYLPVFRIGEVQRYVGAEGHKPKIDRLGGQSWEKARRKVKKEVRALAEELLKLYAQRAALPGFAHQGADAMYRDFEAAFEFEETPDQLKAIEDVTADMERERPMDRLVCGDVGYGKTEVALRACLKAVMSGVQVAMLAPTTVLVEQHFQTMTRRFSGWPITIAKLSRFQSRAEQHATIRGLASGAIDAVVGTHRLLSSDVRFKNLGLMIIDEEQRFGVAHKEKLKRARTQIDALTLTATPIPRTLHMSMAGLRDLSIIATPPADRRSIRTFVARPEDGVLREGVRRELARGGQAFFVAPHIGAPSRGERGLEEWAEKLRELVPEARVAVAHGQMPGDELEKVMVAFVAGEHDILVSTTIIESGLDIPRANTMFVASADRFGLAQLYQLRGRIGRSSERAYCYLLVPPPSALTREARMRLEALQRFSELGAGFQIASHDLEIRGAGELLGAKQSGSIAAVGFEAYTTMLEEAVAELKGEEITRPLDPELNIDIPGFIPDDYVPDTGQRLDLYKRLASADDEDEVRDVLTEIEDRYGPLPLEVTTLGDLMVLKGYARKLRAVSLDLSTTHLALALAEDSPLSPHKLAALLSRRGSGYKLTPDMRLRASFSKDEAETPVASARARLIELGRSASAAGQ
jgi:transcription-repair coupling factor (superfamily II helicase)